VKQLPLLALCGKELREARSRLVVGAPPERSWALPHRGWHSIRRHAFEGRGQDASQDLGRLANTDRTDGCTRL